MDKTIFFKKKYANCTKEVYAYMDELLHENDKIILINSDIEYSNGESDSKNTFVELGEVLKAFELESYEQLMSYWTDMYKDDEKTFEKIVKSLEEKGINAEVSNDKGWTDEGGFYMTDL